MEGLADPECTKFYLLVGIDQLKVSSGSLFLVVSARGASIYLPSRLVLGVDWGLGFSSQSFLLYIRQASNVALQGSTIQVRKLSSSSSVLREKRQEKKSRKGFIKGRL